MMNKDEVGIQLWQVSTVDMAIGAGGLGFDSRADQIRHSVANCSPSLQRFFVAVFPNR